MTRFGIFMVCTAGLALVAAVEPAAAQSAQLDQRVDRLEKEMKAVQRKVFPGGSGKYFEPEFQTPETEQATPGFGQAPGTSTLGNLQIRIESLEQQLANMIGQVEQNGFRLKQLEEQLRNFQTDSEYRFGLLEGTAGAAPSPAGDAAGAGIDAATGADAAAAPAAPAGPSPAEIAYRDAYSYVIANNNARAIQELQAFMDKYPDSSQAASAQYWIGRTYMVQENYAEAARAFIRTYEKYPKSERAPESLYWVGQAMMARGQSAVACEAYKQIDNEYPDAPERLKVQVTDAKAKAQCK